MTVVEGKDHHYERYSIFQVPASPLTILNDYLLMVLKSPEVKSSEEGVVKSECKGY